MGSRMSLEVLGDGFDLPMLGHLGARGSFKDRVINVDISINEFSVLQFDERVSHRVVDNGVIALVLADDDGHVAHGRAGRHVPVVNRQLRGRAILDLSFINVAKELGVGLVRLLLEISDETMASLGEQDVRRQVSSEEHRLNRHDQHALAPSRAQHLQPAEQVDSLVLGLIEQRADPVIVLHVPQRSQVVNHTRYHTFVENPGTEEVTRSAHATIEQEDKKAVLRRRKPSE